MVSSLRLECDKEAGAQEIRWLKSHNVNENATATRLLFAYQSNVRREFNESSHGMGNMTYEMAYGIHGKVVIRVTFHDMDFGDDTATLYHGLADSSRSVSVKDMREWIVMACDLNTTWDAVCAAVIEHDLADWLFGLLLLRHGNVLLRVDSDDEADSSDDE